MNSDEKGVLLVKRIQPGTDGSLEELEELAHSAGYEVLGEVTQVRTPDKAFAVGKGKAEEIAELVAELKPEKVVFDEKLSAVQIYNLSKLCKLEVIDRFNLILEIFASRARTKEAKLQVELASLIYERPKARMKVTLARRGEQPGFKGLGRYQADVYESEITGRIAKIQAELDIIRKRQHETRKQRKEKGFDLVALAGYTNAGKSTLMNALVGESVVAKDQLFTTLVPTTRSLQIGQRKALLTDTVGFIKYLPHFMVEAFRSTLEEIYLADVIILVVDVSEPPEAIVDKLVTCHDTMWDEIGPVPVITALNKSDLITQEELEVRKQAIVHLAPNPVVISARTGEGLDELKRKIGKYLPKWASTEVTLPRTEEGLSMLSRLHDEAIVHHVEYDGNTIKANVEARESVLKRLGKLLEGSAPVVNP
ncbi:MAG TPA: GTPase HflX [Methanocella sp.]|uniref:GTPase HflX n=1 Tax=Methanocella sp. TaxID=2052833 RepID=UPI002CD92741|nr:GTPase HflX [Methanocella sp.]HTY90183.1 GTPase HflX [Methanocella sp.]